MKRLATVIVVLTVVGMVVGASHVLRAAQAETSTIIGCLEEDASGGYVLQNAVEADADGEGEEETYKLTGVVPAGVKLSDHVSHQVQVTGAVTKAPSSDQRSVISMYEFEHVAPSCS